MNDVNSQGELRQYLPGIPKTKVSLGRIGTYSMTDDEVADEVWLAVAD